MSIQYTVYDEVTGAILRTGTALTEASARLQGSKPGTKVTLIGSDPNNEVVDVTPIGIDPGTLPRQAMQVGGVATAVNKSSITADGTDTFVISPVPNGASYDIYLPTNLGLAQPPDGIVTDGKLEITTTVPGVYSVRLAFQTYMDFQVSFNAN
ncbi:hypothetical protein [Massilia sp. TN1-12]|uniref:hypothetical protein n=1 Tax=Massilia paldalensis TaxID=3377675 RepID=UPI00385114DD